MTEALSEDDKSGSAHFDGIGDVFLERLNCYTLAGIIPGRFDTCRSMYASRLQVSFVALYNVQVKSTTMLVAKVIHVSTAAVFTSNCKYSSVSYNSYQVSEQIRITCNQKQIVLLKLIFGRFNFR